MDTTLNYTLNAQVCDNSVTQDDPNDLFLEVVSNGTADKERVINEIMELEPGVEREIVSAVIDYEQRVIQKLLLTGYNVNMGLYYARPMLRGLYVNNAWNPERNSIYVSMTQGKELREAIARTTVNVIGAKSERAYIGATEDAAEAATRAPGVAPQTARGTAGYPLTVTGAFIKIAGDDPAVGLKLTSDGGETTVVPTGMIAVNEPSKLVFVIPAGLPDGAYTLTVTTQFNGGNRLLKSPRVLTYPLTLGDAPAPAPGGGDEGGETGGGNLG